MGKPQISIERIGQLLRETTLTLQEIGDLAGCSRERIRQINEEYGFGNIRERHAARRADASAKRQLMQLPGSRAALRLWRIGEKCRADLLILPGQQNISVNGWRCKAKEASTIFKAHPKYLAEYFRFNTTCRDGDFMVFFCGDSDTYIVPMAEIDAYGTYIAIPANPRAVPYHNLKPRLDWRKYRHAWHLLGIRAELAVTA